VVGKAVEPRRVFAFWLSMLGRCPARTRPPAALRLAFGAKTFLIRSLRSRENFSPGT
jgi:hypothetical protein